MAERLLKVSAELLTILLQGLKSGDPRYFDVECDPLPADVRIVSVRQSDYYEHTVELTLESSAWEEAGPRTLVRPILTVVWPTTDDVKQA